MAVTAFLQKTVARADGITELPGETVALAARYQDLFHVVAGTTLGMMIADVPAVFVGDWLVKKVSLKIVHTVAAVIFAVMGVLALLNVGHAFG